MLFRSLRKTSPWRYAEDPSTQVLCLAIKCGDEDVLLWTPYRELPEVQAAFGKALIQHDSNIAAYLDEANEIEAHNAEFESAIWHHCLHRRLGWPDLPIDKLRCSAAKAATCALPRSLEGAGAALGLPIQKDTQGHSLMLRMCKPRRPSKSNPSEWVEDPVSLVRLAQYCMRDVDAEYQLSGALPEMSPSELEIWRLDQLINRRGLLVDMAAVDHMLALVEQHTDTLLTEFQTLTGGHILTPSRVAALKQYLAEHEGMDLENLTKATVAEALGNDTTSAKAKRLLAIRQSLGKTSVKKYCALKARASADGRMRSNLMYHGASTGRWAGRGFQPQNLPREKIPDPDALLDHLDHGGDASTVEALWGDPMVVASAVIRNSIIAAPGKVFYVGDYNAIESRVLNWIAGEQWAVDAYRQGHDMYRLNAMQIYRCPLEEVTKAQRQIGKVSELALGYQGGLGAFSAMAGSYGVKVEEREARSIVRGWRDAHPEVVRFWKQIELAAKTAVKEGMLTEYRGIQFRTWKRFLCLRLPSGRVLYYYDPLVQPKTVRQIGRAHV